MSSPTENKFEDRELTCVECGCKFVYYADEQERYRNKSYKRPRRCYECRHKRWCEANNVKTYEGICSRCGCKLTKPFKPDPGCKVYCADCAQEHKRGYV